MQIEDNRLLLYAGGGLLASCNLEEEWSETEDKLLTMFRIIE
jgi:isochorismate synthase